MADGDAWGGAVFWASGARVWRASHELFQRWPDLSAKRRLSDGQKRAALQGFVVAGALGLMSPAALLQVLHALGVAVFALAIAWRACAALAGAALSKRRPPRTLDALETPVYTILVPLYREAASVAKLAAALRALDYPEHALDLVFLVEADDHDTLAALEPHARTLGARIIVCPDGRPRTKPRALNIGLQSARGDYLVVYDAEDLPHPNQLKAAAAAFEEGGPNLVCVQAPLVARNAGRAWLAGHWGLEYDQQFGLILPGLARLGLPIMLGGTSNHFRVSALKAAGGWDAWNVTEDADLGLRLARFGGRIGVIAPPTLEEAPETLDVWTAQRSRWIKGFLQTWLVLLPRPRETTARLGLIGALSAHAALASAALSALLHGPALVWLAASIWAPALRPGPVDTALFAAGYGLGLACALAAPGRWTLRRAAALLTLPLYWPLHSLAAARAVYGLIKNPSLWAKTPHELTAEPLPCEFKSRLPAAAPAC